MNDTTARRRRVADEEKGDNQQVIDAPQQVVEEKPLSAYGVQPVHRLLTQQHSYTVYNLVVPRLLPREVLERADLWQHVARQLKYGDEVRVTSQDGSFYAHVYVKFSTGADVLVQVITYCVMDAVDYDSLHNEHSQYLVRQLPGRGWCVVRKADGYAIKDNLPSQSKAYREQEEYIRALRS